MSCIWIAAKILNDKVISNRLYAYLLNVDTSEFNALEVYVMKRLNFDCFIKTETYELYSTEIDKFIIAHNDELGALLEDYKRNKTALRLFKNKIKNESFTSYAWSVNENLNESFADHCYARNISNPKKLSTNKMFKMHLPKSKFESVRRSHSQNKETL